MALAYFPTTAFAVVFPAPHPFCFKDHRMSDPRNGSFRLVEIMGFEPTTYGLQSRRSSQLSYIPSSML